MSSPYHRLLWAREVHRAGFWPQRAEPGHVEHGDTLRDDRGAAFRYELQGELGVFLPLLQDSATIAVLKDETRTRVKDPRVHARFDHPIWTIVQGHGQLLCGEAVCKNKEDCAQGGCQAPAAAEEEEDAWVLAYIGSM